MAEISIITVTYNSKECIGEAFAALEEPIREGRLEWIVVDNASQDGTADYIEQHFPWIKVIRGQENIGFGRGNNLGYQHAQAPYIIFLNPDAVIDMQAIQILQDFLKKHEKIGIVAPAIIEPEGSLQPSFRFVTPKRIFLRAIGMDRFFKQLHYIEPGSAPSKVDWVGGAVFMVKKKMFKQLNGFDPRYFLYWEETDLCFRGNKNNWETWTVGEAIARHTNAVSAMTHKKKMYTGCIAEHFFQSRFYYLRKHYGILTAYFTELGELLLLFCFSPVWKKRFKERLAGPFFQMPKI